MARITQVVRICAIRVHLRSAKDLSQFLGRDDLKLCIGAIVRLLIRTPAAKLSDVTESVTLHMIVCDLDNQFRPQRLPGQIFTLAPTTLTAGHALSIEFRPALPGMRVERILAIGRQELDQLNPGFVAEARADADMLQLSRVIEQTQK